MAQARKAAYQPLGLLGFRIPSMSSFFESGISMRMRSLAPGYIPRSAAVRRAAFSPASLKVHTA
jgi:uncharacterized membrane protein YphA (DoxX/SURF4 family)